MIPDRQVVVTLGAPRGFRLWSNGQGVEMAWMWKVVWGIYNIYRLRAAKGRNEVGRLECFRRRSPVAGISEWKARLAAVQIKAKNTLRTRRSHKALQGVAQDVWVKEEERVGVNMYMWIADDKAHPGVFEGRDKYQRL
jgi:hypothetical protein